MHGAALAGGDVVWSVDETAAKADDAQIFYALPTPDAHHVASQANRCRPGHCEIEELLGGAEYYVKFSMTDSKDAIMGRIRELINDPRPTVAAK